MAGVVEVVGVAVAAVVAAVVVAVVVGMVIAAVVVLMVVVPVAAVPVAALPVAAVLVAASAALAAAAAAITGAASCSFKLHTQRHVKRLFASNVSSMASILDASAPRCCSNLGSGGVGTKFRPWVPGLVFVCCNSLF